jgi:hypothetical protein
VPRTSRGRELRAVLLWLVSRRESWVWLGALPGVRDDYIVEGGMLLAEAGESDSEDHCIVLICGDAGAGVTCVSVDVRGLWDFWGRG